MQQLGSWKEAPVAHVPQWILTPVATSACSLQLEVDSWRLNLLWEKIWFLALEINFTCTDSKCENKNVYCSVKNLTLTLRIDTQAVAGMKYNRTAKT